MPINIQGTGLTSTGGGGGGGSTPADIGAGIDLSTDIETIKTAVDELEGVLGTAADAAATSGSVGTLSAKLRFLTSVTSSVLAFIDSISTKQLPDERGAQPAGESLSIVPGTGSNMASESTLANIGTGISSAFTQARLRGQVLNLTANNWQSGVAANSRLVGFIAQNIGTVPVYIQYFDRTTVPVNGDVPLQSTFLPVGAVFILDDAFYGKAGDLYTNSIVIGVSSTNANYTGTTSILNISIRYYNP